MDTRWEDPPAISRTGRVPNQKEREAAVQLRADPDRWMRLHDFEGEEQRKAGQFAQQIRAGKRAAFRADRATEDGEFEAVSRKIKGTDITAVYVKYATLNND